MSIARSIEIDVYIYRKRSVYLYNSVASWVSNENKVGANVTYNFVRASAIRSR